MRTTAVKICIKLW